jgi:hypothetical protein
MAVQKIYPGDDTNHSTLIKAAMAAAAFQML